MNEAQHREAATCAVCSREKTVGALVCWECFSYEAPGGVAPLKYADMPFTQWLAQF